MAYKMSNEKDDKQVISNTERVEVKRSGTSDTLRIPAHWRRSFMELKGSKLLFDAFIEKDSHGSIFIVFKKVNVDLPKTREEVKK